MNKRLLIITFVAFALVVLVAISYGPAALLFPLLLVIGFFVSFAVMIFNAQIQADANPGIEKIEKPDFWFSSIYNAWLFTNDIEGWAVYATIISLISTAFFGSLFGSLFLLMAHAAPSGIYESWLAGMFLTCLIAINVVRAEYWAKQSKMKRSKVATSEL
ncbi:MAG: hypothetical protein ACE5OV_02935 [Candidatus Bathyarchaeia archaeon]